MKISSKLKRLLNPFLHALFWVGFGAAFWGAFEMAFQATEYAPHTDSAIWSGTFGFPFFHHYIYGFIMVGVVWILVYIIDFFLERNKAKINE